MKPAFVFFALLAGISLIFPLETASQDYTLPWSSVDGGGGRLSGASWSVGGTVGQPDAYPLSGAEYVTRAGFWSDPSTSGIRPTATPTPEEPIATPTPTPPSVSGDTNGDGVISSDDYLYFSLWWHRVPNDENAACNPVVGPGERDLIDEHDLYYLIHRWNGGN